MPVKDLVRFICIIFAFVKWFVEFPEDHVVAYELEQRVVVGEQHQRFGDELVPLRWPGIEELRD